MTILQTPKIEHREHNSRKNFGSRMLVGCFIILSVFSSLLPYEITRALTPSGASTETSLNLHIGSFNVLKAFADGGEGACNAKFKSRMGVAAKNIVAMGMDIVGAQELSCGNALLDALGSGWKQTDPNVKRGSLTENETAILWNTSKVSLISSDVIKIPGWQDARSGCHLYGGGSWNIAVGLFRDNYSGQQFYIASSHWINGGTHTTSATCLSTRIKDTQVIINWFKDKMNTAIFIVGDTNSKTTYKPTILPTLEAAGFYDASKTALDSKYDHASTMASGGSKDGSSDAVAHIDRIFYNKAAGTPSYYETKMCQSIASCGSDHRPIVAVFGSLTTTQGLLNQEGCYTPNEDQFDAWTLNLYDPTCVAACTATPTLSGIFSGSLPQKTLDQIKSSDVDGKLAKMIDIYKYASAQTKVPWQFIAALHWREANMRPGTTIQNGEPLGNGLTIDGAQKSADANEDAVLAAKHLIELAKGVYSVDITSSSVTIDDIGNAFLAYNRGKLYKLAGHTYQESPYVMNGYDDAHIGMHWVGGSADPGASTRSGGLDGNPIGALTMTKYLYSSFGGGSTTASTLSSLTPSGCDASNPADMTNVSLDGIDPNSLPEPKGSGHSSWTTDAMNVAKIVWHLFPNAFTELSTRSAGGANSTSCHFKGLAIDMMIANYKDPAVRKKIEGIAEWLMKNRSQLKITNIIYYDKSFSVWSNSSDKPYSDWDAYNYSYGAQNDTTQHRDHIHVSIEPCKG